MLTPKAVFEEIDARMGGTPGISSTALADRVGEHIVSMHKWQWLVRPAARIALVADRTSFKLPSDFGRFIAIQNASAEIDFDLVSQETLAALRGDTLAAPSCYYGCISYTAPLSGGGLQPRMEVWPPIGTSSTDTFSLIYSAGWEPVANATDALPIPTWIEMLFTELSMAVAQGYSEHDNAGIDARLAAVETGPIAARAKQRDGSVRPTVGRISGGAMGMYLNEQRAAVGFAVRTLPPA